MLSSKASTVAQYLSALPADRREALEKVRRVILKALPKGYVELMQYGVIGYAVPLSLYPLGYHCKKQEPLPFLSLASQKNHMSLSLMCLYGYPEAQKQFEKDYAKAGKKLDMGRSCIRFKKVEDLALDVIAKAIKSVSVREYVKTYETVVLSATAKKQRASKRKK